MNTFLAEVVEDLLSNESSFEKHICVIPNKRMALFFKKHFKNQQKGVSFLPAFYTLNDFLKEANGPATLNQLELMIQLYLTYRELTNEEIQFNDFMGWGGQILKDFNEIDLYEVNPKDLFSYISDARALEVWNVDGSEITPFQRRYLSFWQSLENLYHLFREKLNEKGEAYSGMAFQFLLKNMEKLENRFSGYRFSIVGFNALSAIEQSFFKELSKSFEVKFYWDSDQFSLNSAEQESAWFLRRFEHHFESWKNTFDSREQKKTIEIYSCAQNVLQGKLVNQILNKIPKEEWKDTAVLMADENLLIPLLNAVPESSDAPNVSMGYPLKNTEVFTFVEMLLDLKIRQGKHRQNWLYHKDFLRLLEHEFSVALFGWNWVNSVKTEIIKLNYIYIDPDWLFEKHPVDLVWMINCVKANWFQQFEASEMVTVLEESKSLLAKDSDWLSEQFFVLINRFADIEKYASEYPFISEIRVFRKLFRQLVAGEQLDLIGEPLSGMQVMGLLESRGLDFKNVIVTNVNEGVLPKANKGESFIPYDIKTQFDMPTWYEKDAIYAYYLHQSIQRAERVYLMYAEQTEDTGGGEKSRFITQMIHEWKHSHEGVDIKEVDVSPEVKGIESEKVQIEKGPDVISQLQNWAERGASPSAINTYIDCTLNFYYRYVVGLREIEEVEESISASTFGSILHKTLEDVFHNHFQKELKEEDFDKMLIEFPKYQEKRFLEYFRKSDFSSGKNYLSYRVAYTQLKRVFEEQKKEWREKLNESLRIVAIEENYEAFITLNNGIKVKIIGNADRVDDIGGIRIVDYKSGKVEQKDISISDLEDIRKKPKALQLLTYAWLYYKSTGIVPKHAGNISFRQLKQFFIPVKVKKSDVLTEEVLLEFEEQLKSILEEVFNEELNFFHTLDKDQGKYCEYCE